MSAFELHRGDCLTVLKTMADNSVDSIVTDPPYGLSDHKPAEVVECLRAWLDGQVYQPKGTGFMSAKWDAWVPGPEVWREALRVLKPGGHLLAFAGTRSMDLMCMAVRLAGFEMRDAIGYAHDDEGGQVVDAGGAPLMAWAYGSGFPKSMDVSKAIDKAAGAERERHDRPAFGGTFSDDNGSTYGTAIGDTPITEAAHQWQGWGTALKPAWEPIILARKPLAKGNTVAANVLQHGTGALNIDACRVPATDNTTKESRSAGDRSRDQYRTGTSGRPVPTDVGRWPANLIHDGSDAVLAAFPDSVGSGPARALKRGERGDGAGWGMQGANGELRDAGTGSAARFFYCPKASAADRHEGLPDPGPQFKKGSTLRDAEKLNAAGERKGNHHPTVKPTALFRYLQRLVTPPGGKTMDFYMGSGSSGKAAMLEGFEYVGVERDEDDNGEPLGYMEIARVRVGAAHQFATEAAARAQEAVDAQRDLFGEAAA